jgi:hypothetical protein
VRVALLEVKAHVRDFDAFPVVMFEVAVFWVLTQCSAV